MSTNPGEPSWNLYDSPLTTIEGSAIVRSIVSMLLDLFDSFFFGISLNDVILLRKKSN